MPQLANTVAASSLPPIMGGMGGQNGKYEQKSARTLLPSNNTQKKRRKYKISAQQQVPARP